MVPTSESIAENRMLCFSLIVGLLSLCLASSYLPLAFRAEFSQLPLGSDSDILKYKEQLAFSIAISNPLICDAIYSVFDGILMGSITRKGIYLSVARIYSLLTLSLPDFICYLHLGSHGFSSKLFICSFVFKYVASIGNAGIIIFQNKSSNLLKSNAMLGPKYLLLLMSICVVIAEICSIVTISSSVHYHKLGLAAAIFFDLACCLLVILCISCVIHEISAVRRKEVKREDTVIAMCLILLASKLAIDQSIIFESKFSFASGGQLAVKEVCNLGYVQAFFVIGIVLLPSRIEQTKLLQWFVEMLEEKSSFLRYISHELRTPLNINQLSVQFVKGEIKSLKRVLGSTKARIMTEALDDIDTSCKTVVGILDDVLTFDKMKSGKFTLELQDTMPLDFCKTSFRQFVVLAEEGEVDYRFECDGEDTGWLSLCRIQVDNLKLAQVLRNLLSNAFKFTPSGGRVTMKVSVCAVAREASHIPVLQRSDSLSRLRRNSVVPQGPEVLAMNEKKWLRLEVIDSGAGISKENQKKLFGQYVQFNANQLQKGKGSGLGLWISKGIVAMHDGFLWAQSPGEGLGSRFVVELPLFPVVGDSSDVQGAPAAQSLSRSNSRKFLLSSNWDEICSQVDLNENMSAVELNEREDSRRGREVVPAEGSGGLEFLSQALSSSRLSGLRDAISVRSEGRVAGGPFPALTLTSARLTSTRLFNKPTNLDKYSAASSDSGEGEEGSAAFGPLAATRAPETVDTVTSAGPAPELRSSFSAWDRDPSCGDVQSKSFKLQFARALALWDSGLSFLVVDDSAPSRRVLGRLLDMNKHTTSFASSGQEFLDMMRPSVEVPIASDSAIADAEAGTGRSAFAAASQMKVDVVLMDHHMPGMSGPKTVQTIRERGYKGLIVGLTGDTLEDDISYFKAHGVDEVLSKPLQLEQLKLVVCVHLQGGGGERSRDQIAVAELAMPLSKSGLLNADGKMQRHAGGAELKINQQVPAMLMGSRRDLTMGSQVSSNSEASTRNPMVSLGHLEERQIFAGMPQLPDHNYNSLLSTRSAVMPVQLEKGQLVAGASLSSHSNHSASSTRHVASPVQLEEGQVATGTSLSSHSDNSQSTTRNAAISQEPEI